MLCSKSWLSSKANLDPLVPLARHSLEGASEEGLPVEEGEAAPHLADGVLPQLVGVDGLRGQAGQRLNQFRRY